VIAVIGIIPYIALQLKAVSTTFELLLQYPQVAAAAKGRTVALVALQSDAFLDALPEAALRVSACDSTPVTRRVLARMIAARARDRVEASAARPRRAARTVRT